MFMFAEPLQGWRHVRVRAQRTKVDWALEMEALLRTRYAEARKVLVVCDNLNTHTMGAFYEAFAAERARKLVRRLEFRYTPKHGSGLNIAENELSALTRQCLHDRRFGATKQLAEETAAWSTSSNEKQHGGDWQFKINDARTKLKASPPKFETKKHGASDHINNCMTVSSGGYSASNFAGPASSPSTLKLKID